MLTVLSVFAIAFSLNMGVASAEKNVSTDVFSVADLYNMKGSDIVKQTVHMQQILQQEKQLHPSRDMPEKIFYVTEEQLDKADNEMTRSEVIMGSIGKLFGKE